MVLYQNFNLPLFPTKASAMLHSIIETAKANGREPFA